MAREPDVILARVLEVYANCRSYRDEGVVTTTFFGPAVRTERKPFSTRFVRPNGFRFEFRRRRGEDHWDQYAIWLENNRARAWWNLQPDREDPESLARAIAGATGVSGCSAYRAPHLLMPELGEDGKRRKPLPEPVTLIDVPEAAAQNCVVIVCPRRFGSEEQIWVDPASWLIRRVVEPRHVLEPPPVDTLESLKAINPELAARLAQNAAAGAKRERTEVESITTYEAEFDAAIAPEELRFTPPLE